MNLRMAADETARDHLASVTRKVKEIDVTLTRNAILDCLFASPEPDFIAKAANDPIYGSDARRVFGMIDEHLDALVSTTLDVAKAGA